MTYPKASSPRTVCSPTTQCAAKPSVQKKTKEDLDSLTIWKERWSMSFHPQKCTALNVTRKREKKQICYQLHEHAIENVITTKYLGVNIQDNTNWGTHINTITNRANKTFGFLDATSRSATRRQRKLRKKPLFDRYLSMQPQSGVPTLKLRSAP